MDINDTASKQLDRLSELGERGERVRQFLITATRGIIAFRLSEDEVRLAVKMLIEAADSEG